MPIDPVNSAVNLDPSSDLATLRVARFVMSGVLENKALREQFMSTMKLDRPGLNSPIRHLILAGALSRLEALLERVEQAEREGTRSPLPPP